MIVNLTPHPVNVRRADGTEEIIPPSGQQARAAQTEAETGQTLAGLPVIETSYGKIENLPEPVEGTYYLVSSLVRSALPKGERPDVLVPARPTRDTKGMITGCQAFSR